MALADGVWLLGVREPEMLGRADELVNEPPPGKLLLPENTPTVKTAIPAAMDPATTTMTAATIHPSARARRRGLSREVGPVP